MKTELFDFRLPDEFIAQHPLPDRDASKLLVLNRAARTWTDSCTRDLPQWLRAGDVLVLNDTRVIPARLRATRDSSGGKIEFLLLPPETHAPELGPSGGLLRRVLTKSGGKLLPGESFSLAKGCKVILREKRGEAGDVVEFLSTAEEFHAYVQKYGEVPLPPYIRRPAGPSAVEDFERYQTVYAQTPGAVAAPTAGLHFSQDVLKKLEANGVECRRLTLHVGPGTFRPVKSDTVEGHFVDAEPYTIPAETLAAVLAAKREGRRVIAVGTTSLRALEGSGIAELSVPRAVSGATNLFIHPPHNFKIAGGLLTNFHIPKSSLLMLVCAFAAPGSDSGIEWIRQAYRHAMDSGYRFYSYGDACLIT